MIILILYDLYHIPYEQRWIIQDGMIINLKR